MQDSGSTTIAFQTLAPFPHSYPTKMDSTFVIIILVLSVASVVSPTSPDCQAEHSVRDATLQTATCSSEDVTTKKENPVIIIEMLTASGTFLANLDMQSKTKAERGFDQNKSLAIRSRFYDYDETGTFTIGALETVSLDFDEEQIVCRYHLDHIMQPEQKNARIDKHPAEEHTWKMHAGSKSEPAWAEIEVETADQTVLRFNSADQPNTTLEFVRPGDMHDPSIRRWKRLPVDNAFLLVVVASKGSQLATGASTKFEGRLMFDKLRKCRASPSSHSSSSSEPCSSQTQVYLIPLVCVSVALVGAVGVIVGMSVVLYRKQPRKTGENELPEGEPINLSNPSQQEAGELIGVQVQEDN